MVDINDDGSIEYCISWQGESRFLFKEKIIFTKKLFFLWVKN